MSNDRRAYLMIGMGATCFFVSIACFGGFPAHTKLAILYAAFLAGQATYRLDRRLREEQQQGRGNTHG